MGLAERKRAIKVLVMDVDGTLTDGRIYIGPAGEVMKVFYVKDGYGVKTLLPKAGIVPVIITGRESDALMFRCRELGIEWLRQGIQDKLPVLDEMLREIGDSIGEALDCSNVAYIGDDMLDLECMKPVRECGGLTGCPADAVREVRVCSDFVSDFKGGEGAVRDFIEWLSRE